MSLHKFLIKIHFYPLLFFLVLVSIIIFSWFRHGLMYGGGDVGLPIYNPQRVLEIALKPWWSETAPGFPRPQSLAALPAQFFFAFLQIIGLPPFIIQAVVFAILLFLMGWGMYLLSLDVIKQRKDVAILAASFYMINPYMMVLVWHRFVYGSFFLAAALPFLLLFWRKWIKEKIFLSLILFILINLIFSYMFTTLAYVITLWFLLGIYTLFAIVAPWRGWQNAIKLIGSFTLGLVLWVLTSSWWLLPVFFIAPSLVSMQHSVSSNVATLIAISQQSIIPYTLAGLNSFYLFQREELGGFFKHPLFLFIPWLTVIFIILGIYYVTKKKEASFFGALFISAVFLAKGAAAPLGYIFLFLFERFFFLGLLRNPFEKFGLLIPFAGSILFSIGFITIAYYFWSKKNLVGKASMILILGLFFGVYHWPFWTGSLLGTGEKRNFVEIPQYYHQANKWIKEQKKEGNILHLPLAIAESSTYRWQYGYSGAESNVDFFTSNPSISMGFNLSYLDDALYGFDLMTKYDQEIHREYLKELFRSFNVRFIVLHHDIDWQASAVQSPQKIATILNSLPFLKKTQEFGELTIYEIKETSFLSKIYLSSFFNYLEPGLNYNSWAWFWRIDPAKPFLSNVSSDEDPLNLPGREGTVIIPNASIKMPSSKLISEENAVKELPAIRFLPDSPFYYLIIIKEIIQEKAFQRPQENIPLTYAGKRLVEAYRLSDKHPEKSVSGIIKRYIGYLDKAVAKIAENKVIGAELSNLLQLTLTRHQTVLEQLRQKVKEEDRVTIEHALNTLRQKMVEMNMQPLYELVTEKGLSKYNRRIHRFFIPVDGEYEILLADSNVSLLYQKNLNPLDLQIDNVIQSRNAQIKGDLISYGTVFLKSGEHEISFNMQSSINLFKGKEQEMELESGQHTPTIYDIKIEPFYPDSAYLVSLEYWTQKGNDPIVRTFEDSDPSNPNSADSLNKLRDYQFSGAIEYNPYIKYWKPFSYYLSPRKNSSQLSFQIVSTPWEGDCKRILVETWLCNKPEIKYHFEKPSTIAVRNIKVVRILDNALFLRTKIGIDLPDKPINLDYIKKTPLSYEGHIVVDKPTFLVFSETFHKEWELTLFDGASIYKPSKHFIANMYGNGWFLDKRGNYKFILKFSPAKYFNIGLYLSISTLVILITVVLILKKYLYKSHYEKNN